MLKVCYEETNYDNPKDILHEFNVKSYRLWILTLPTQNKIVSIIKTPNQYSLHTTPTISHDATS